MDKPTVFVSSTIEEMRSTRLVVRKLLEQDLGYHVLMSEYEGSKPKKPIAQCKKWAKECDIFISILGVKYGWIIPGAGMSVSEMEFNEASKDNPEKILVYISALPKDERQNNFAQRISDFSQGFYRRTPFNDDQTLVNGIREDLADFFKERLDYLRTKALKVRTSITPSTTDYASQELRKRHVTMMADAISVFQQLGCTPIKFFDPYFWLATKTINRYKVLFSLSVYPINFDKGTMTYYTARYYTVQRSDIYKSHPNRFNLSLVHGNATLRTFQFLVNARTTCFKVEPGIYYGVGLDIPKTKSGSVDIENCLILPQIRNKQDISIRLSDAIEWLTRESNRIDFRRNYEKLRKIKLLKWKSR